MKDQSSGKVLSPELPASLLLPLTQSFQASAAAVISCPLSLLQTADWPGSVTSEREQVHAPVLTKEIHTCNGTAENIYTQAAQLI